MRHTKADEFVSTPAEQACLRALRHLTRDSKGPIERHSLRVFLIAEELARLNGMTLDREALLCAALLHDAGLYRGSATPHRFYLRKGRSFAEELLGPLNWPSVRLQRCLDAVELHHRLRPQWAHGEEVELLRLADLVDASRGVVAFGIRRKWLREIFEALPRGGLYRELARRSHHGLPCLTRALPAILLHAGLRRPRPPRHAR